MLYYICEENRLCKNDTDKTCVATFASAEDCLIVCDSLNSQNNTQDLEEKYEESTELEPACC
jgi:hypothetical protein